MRQRLCTLATCNLNQWALDFEGNLARIVASIAAAKGRGALYRVRADCQLQGWSLMRCTRVVVHMSLLTPTPNPSFLLGH